MRDLFAEEVVVNLNYKREKVIYDIMTVLGVVSLFLLITWIILFLFYFITLLGDNFLINVIVFLLPGVIFALIGWLLFKFRNKFCIEYDYSLVDDSIRIDKVVRSVRRFEVTRFSGLDVEKIGKFGSDECNKYLSLDSVICEYLTPNDLPNNDKDFWYIVANTQGNKMLFVIECSDFFVKNLLKVCKKGVLEVAYK